MRVGSKTSCLPVQVIVLLFSLVSVGCTSWGDVSAPLRVDQGVSPEYQDEQVRFRTTYYFRVVDSCKVDDGEMGQGAYSQRLDVFNVRKRGMPKIVNDSFYRFRMTGKAAALFAKIHFESGVLRAEQIDPFGATVKYDEQEEVFRVESPSVYRERNRRDEIVKEIERLQNLKKTVQGVYAAEEIINMQIRSQARLLKYENESRGLDEPGGKSLLCPDGRPTKRSYYLYGPEGVRKLDPDERLLMAMSSDSKPLISMLRQLSGKQQQAQVNQVSSLKELLAERVALSELLQDISQEKAKSNKNEEEFSKFLQEISERMKTKKASQ